VEEQAPKYNGLDMMVVHKLKLIQVQVTTTKKKRKEDQLLVALVKFELLYNLFNLSFTCHDKVIRHQNLFYRTFFKTSTIGETATTTGAPQIGPSVGPAPAIQQTASGAPNVVYIPRNVYVPVIKPVFVPREREFFLMKIIK